MLNKPINDVDDDDDDEILEILCSRSYSSSFNYTVF